MLFQVYRWRRQRSCINQGISVSIEVELISRTRLCFARSIGSAGSVLDDEVIGIIRFFTSFVSSGFAISHFCIGILRGFAALRERRKAPGNGKLLKMKLS